MVLRASLIFALVTACAGTAQADALDGGWCGGSGRQLFVKGPEITTPSGVVLQGDYRRHHFVYIAPAGDPDAGLQIFLQQINEKKMNFYRIKDGKFSPAELWQRCDITS